MAIKSQTTLLQVSSAAGATKTITGITKANPAVVTSTAHGLANGSVIVISGVVGMTELNGRAFVVANQATNSFELRGVDSTNYTTYASGGIGTPQTLVSIGEVTTFSGFDGSSTIIDATHLRSTAKEKLVGLQDFGGATFGMNYVSDTGQTRLRALKGGGQVGYFLLTLSDASVVAFPAYVQSFSVDVGGPDDKVSAQCQVVFAYEPAGFV